MHIVYSVTTCSDRVYKQLFSEVAVKPAFQSQKYHRLLIAGLAVNTKVDVVANPPVNRSVMSKKFINLPREEADGAHYHYIPAIRNSVAKTVAVGFGTFFQTFFLIQKDSAVIVDCLNRVAAFSALLAARLRKKPCVGIVTDLPDMLGGSGFSKKIANFVIRHCSAYVLLTEAMNGYLNQSGKPYVVLEGHADITMAEQCSDLEEKVSPRVCFYAGGVSKQYGLENLVQGFRKADIPNTQLHIYGPGDYVEELQKIAENDNRIYYGGMLLNTEIVEKEQEATLLVNPRPTDEEYVKYSFPSKTMEYMASGTPVLTTRLPGMPKEYKPYVYFIEQEDADGIKDALQKVLSQDAQTLHNFGMEAKDFVLKEKNNVAQAAKVLTFIENTFGI